MLPWNRSTRNSRPEFGRTSSWGHIQRENGCQRRSCAKPTTCHEPRSGWRCACWSGKASYAAAKAADTWFRAQPWRTFFRRLKSAGTWRALRRASWRKSQVDLVNCRRCRRRWKSSTRRSASDPGLASSTTCHAAGAGRKQGIPYGDSGIMRERLCQLRLQADQSLAHACRRVHGLRPIRGRDARSV